MLTTASCWRECTRCFCFASPCNFAFTWATGITIHINSCPVKCRRNVASSDRDVRAYRRTRPKHRSPFLSRKRRFRRNGSSTPEKLYCGEPRSGSGRIVGNTEVMTCSMISSEWPVTRPQLAASSKWSFQLPTTGLLARSGSCGRQTSCGGSRGTLSINVREDKTAVASLPFSESETRSRVESSSRAEFR